MNPLDSVHAPTDTRGLLPHERLRRAIAAGVAASLGPAPASFAEYAEPLGDPGLFGPTSIAWRVHADLPAMLIGGISSLMFQTLNPLAMAGVARHSRFREDPTGRLQRTARYVAGTTFGPVRLADEIRREVRRAHAPVHGMVDGRAYSASDPDLVTWVHTTEVWSFLRSYQRYARRPLDLAERDRYLAEVTVLAERLGAREVPTSVSEVRSYLRAVEPELVATDEALEAVAFLRRPLEHSPGHVIAHRVLADAAIDLLPTFARKLLQLDRLPVVSPVTTRVAATELARLMRWAIGPSVIARIAAERAGPA